MAHFEVGKKVICVKSAKNNLGMGVEKGKVYPLNAIRKDCCSNNLMFDVGITYSEKNAICANCKKLFYDGILWAEASLFAPYDDSLSETTVEELLYQLTE